MKFQNATPVSPDAIRPFRFQSGCVAFGRRDPECAVAAFPAEISGPYLPNREMKEEGRGGGSPCFKGIIPGERRETNFVYLIPRVA